MEFQVTLIRTLVALVPACMLFSGSLVLFFRGKTVCSFLQLLGAGCLVVVVLTHVSEALHLFPWMHWGLEHSAGHYLDLWSAIIGLTLFPVGYLFHALTKRHAYRPEEKWAQAVPATRAAPKLGRAGHDPAPRARSVAPLR